MQSVHDYYYDLPQKLIAQTPLLQRDACRLLVVDRKTETLSHKHFFDVIDYMNPGDALVINDSRVIPARLYGVKIKETDSPDSPCAVEVVLLRQLSLDRWDAIVRPGKRLKAGAKINFSDIMTGVISEVDENGDRIIDFTYDKNIYENIYIVLDKIGKMPLPPYIKAALEDNESYQTVYSDEAGSAAAPTAGLHFTNELLEKIQTKGISIVRVMLHVGLGTFRPVKEDYIENHKMHSEFFTVTKAAADKLNEIRANGGRIIATGTTSARVLESSSDENGIIFPQCRDTDIFIYPPYKFKAVDSLITNFHLPESTLLMLVSALSSRELMMKAYEEAVKEEYRFFSFGDAMLIE